MNLIEESVLAIHMGDRFKCLAPLLQTVHLGRCELSGAAYVRQGNFFAKCICNIFKFPKPGEDVHLRVECEHTASTMQWTRYFNQQKMQSHFCQRDDFLEESLGPLKLRFKAVEREGRLEYQFIKTRCFGIAVPRFFCPQIDASECESEGAYQFSVAVKMRVIGMVICYGGKLNLNVL